MLQTRRGLLLGCGAVLLAGAALRPNVAMAHRSPPRLHEYPDQLSGAEIDAVFARAMAELQTKTRAHVAAWGMDEAAWAADLAQGTISFSRGDAVVATAPVQVIGTLVADSGTWMWGWDHPSVPPPVGADARRVQAFGAVQQLAALTTRQIRATAEDAWQFTALAAHLSGAAGAYRGPAGKAAVFMTFGAPAMAPA